MIATLLGTGYVPIAPGTAGSALIAVVYYFFFASVAAVDWLVLLAATFVVGVYTANRMSREWGPDPGRVVVDEGVGYLVTVAFLPHGIWSAALGFLVFRILDIWKPFPARQFERLPGGWGIVADDVMAGIYGNLLLRLVFAALGI